MANPTPIALAPRDGSYVRLSRPTGGYALAYWCREHQPKDKTDEG